MVFLWYNDIAPISHDHFPLLIGKGKDPAPFLLGVRVFVMFDRCPQEMDVFYSALQASPFYIKRPLARVSMKPYAVNR